MGNEPSDDYFEAAAGVIEAARELDEAREAHRVANEAAIETFARQRKAEEKLSAAIGRLKGARVDRGESG